MAIRKTRTKRRESFEFADRDYLVICLISGHDFFAELPEDEADRMELLKAAWKDAEIRKAVYTHCRKTDKKQPWAEKQFGRKEPNP